MSVLLITNENSIKDNLENYSSIQFSKDILEENLIKNLEILYEYEKVREESIAVDVKMLSMELKIALFKHALQYESLLNSYIILNIFNLIKGYNTFDDSYFDEIFTYFNNLEEYLDIKIQLNREISEFTKKLMIYYVSIMKSCGAIENPVVGIEIPYLYQRILYISDFVSLSNMFMKCPNFNTEELIVINGAYDYITMLANKFSIGNMFLEALQNVNNDK